MGLHTSREALVLRWAELCADPALRDLPYKLELNAYGTIEMSPASTRRARLQGALAGQLARALPIGEVLAECAIATEEGVRVPDVAWAGAAFIAQHGDASPLPAAPEICIEIRSLSNSDAEMAMKTRAYLAAGAVEVWIVDESGAVAVQDGSGPVAASRYGVQFNWPPIQ